MAYYQQLPINVQFSLVSNPPVGPVDVQTGLPPQFWVRRAASVNVSIFDSTNAAVDLSNIVYMQLVFSTSPNALAPSITQTVYQANINSNITYQAWLAGNATQMSFVLSQAATDVSLEGQNSLPYYMQLQGLTNTGNYITYGAGYVEFYNPGYNVPAPTGFYVSYHNQTSNSSQNFTVSPTSNLHTEWISLAGSPGSRNCIVSGYGLNPGAHVYLRFSTGTAFGVIIDVYDTSINNPILCTFTSDQYTPAGELHLVWNGTNYQVLDTIVPAAGTLS